MTMKLNPLLIEPILEIIFDHLSQEDLKQCISVCELWSKEACRILLKRQEVSIDGHEELKTLLEKLNTKGIQKISKLEAENLNLGDPLFKQLLVKVEPTLGELKLNNGRVTVQTLHRLLLSLPNLHRLEIGIVKHMFGMYHQLFPIYDRSTNPPQEVILDKLLSLEFLSFETPLTPISAALKTCPNLRSLTVSNGQIEPSNNFNGIVMPHLKELSMTNYSGPTQYFKDGHIEMLMKAKFPSLKKLKLSNLDPVIRVSFFKEFIESFKDTLETLDLCYYNLYPGELQGLIDAKASIKIFPLDLPNLNELFVDKQYIQNLGTVFISVPKLASVVVDIKNRSNWAKIMTRNMKEQKHIRTIGLSNMDGKQFETLSKVFSGVTSLKIDNCDDKFLHTIYLNMPQLEVLICYDTENHIMTSEGITGIPIKNLQKVASMYGRGREHDVREMTGDCGGLRTMPYIAMLTKLKHAFLFFTKNGCADFMLCGFLGMPNLKAVTMENQTLSSKILGNSEGKEGDTYVYIYTLPKKNNIPAFKLFFCDPQDAIRDFSSYPNL